MNSDPIAFNHDRTSSPVSSTKVMSDKSTRRDEYLESATALRASSANFPTNRPSIRMFMVVASSVNWTRNILGLSPFCPGVFASCIRIEQMVCQLFVDKLLKLG